MLIPQVINEGLPFDIPDSLQELSITNTLLMKRPRSSEHTVAVDALIPFCIRYCYCCCSVPL